MIKAFYIVLTLFLGCSIDQTGCTNPSACNYSDTAISDDGSCYFAEEGFDCYGNCEDSAYDCMGDCFGGAIMDDSGECCYFEDIDGCGVCYGEATNSSECAEEGYSLSIANVDIANGTLDVVMNNEGSVAGFQFNVDGVNVTGASGGSATSNGFQVSTSTTTVIGFSLTGATIPASNGMLVTVEFNSSDDTICLSDVVLVDSSGQPFDVVVGECFDCPLSIIDCQGECGGSAIYDECGVCDGFGAVFECGCEDLAEGTCDCEGNVEDCTGECGGSAVYDECGVCDGGVTDSSECAQEGYSLSLANIDIANGTLDVVMNNEEPVAGFQFKVEGVDVTGAYGGSAEQNDFTISYFSNTVVGFSLTGATIPASNGILVTIEFNPSGDRICLSDVILSNPLGEAVDVVVGECFDYPDAPIVSIYFSSPYDIYGFQFVVDNATILSTSGGLAEQNDFTISYSSNTVVGFSFEEDFIPAGDGILIELKLDNEDVCITDLVLTGPGNIVLNYTLDCQSITVID